MEKQNARRARWLLAAGILAACVGCDQATKCLATHTLRDEPPREYLGETIRLEYMLNPGGFLSMGSRWSHQTRQWVFVGLNSVLIAGLGAFLVLSRRASLSMFVCCALVLAGALGNQIDRILNDGLVTDFVSLGVGPVRTGVFNVADVALMFGAIALALLSFRQRDGAQSKPPQSKP